MNKAMKRAVDAAGSQRALARLVETSPQHIAYMLRNKASAEWVLKIANAVPEVSKEQLRPDLYPVEN